MAKEIRPTNLKPQAKVPLADKLVNLVGSWKFIITQTAGMFIWVLLNVATPYKVDPFPFILLNLALSTQAALLGPVILMSSTRNETIDRKRDIEDSLTIDKISEELEKLTEHVEDRNDPKT